MKNINYNLLKVLHCSLDDTWRIEKHYLKDAKSNCPSCQKLLKKIDADVNKHIKMLKDELAAHIKKNKLN